MPSRSSSDLRHETKQEPKLYSRLLTKDSSAANPSFRVYYGGATGAVPFVWESQPGTPKSSIATTTLPPLTPPPSYHVSPSHKAHNKGFSTSTTMKSPKFTLIRTFLPRLITLRKTNSPPAAAAVFSLSSPSLSSSSSSFSPAGSAGSRHRSRFSSSRSSFSDEDSDDESPTSTMCFGVRRGDAGRGQGCYSVMIMKNALLSIVGHGSSQDTA